MPPPTEALRTCFGAHQLIAANLTLTTTPYDEEAFGTPNLNFCCSGGPDAGTWYLSAPETSNWSVFSGSRGTPIGVVLLSSPHPHGISGLAKVASRTSSRERMLPVSPPISQQVIPRETVLWLRSLGPEPLDVVRFTAGARLQTRDGHLALVAVATTGTRDAPHLVTRLDAWGTRILLAGAADTASLVELSETPRDTLRSDVLIVLRPDVALPPALLDRVGPRLVVQHGLEDGVSWLRGEERDTLTVGLFARAVLRLSPQGYRVETGPAARRRLPQCDLERRDPASEPDGS